MNPLEITRGASLYIVTNPAGIWLRTPSSRAWHAPAGSIATLDPASRATAMAIQAGQISFAPAGAVDNTAQPDSVRGQAGMRVAVSN
jgi:hypothetical protein